ncbi:MAG: arsenite methyltransferase [Dehalococcoidia bacterium]|nr:arsenite methyltransferase [Dehalococcoidia bacterium]
MVSQAIGYSPAELQTIPEGANLGLGCGNPVALASLIEGEVVLDLGAGAGMDAFLAANTVGKTGKVIGVDMTPDMIERSRGIARKNKYANVEFRLGEIENLPVADNTVDVIISNCVINLSPDKPQVFREAFRVLKPGGRLMVSDLVLLKPLPASVLKSAGAYVSCIGGASLKTEYLKAIDKAGFKDVKVVQENALPLSMLVESPALQDMVAEAGVTVKELADTMRSVVSVRVHAVKA